MRDEEFNALSHLKSLEDFQLDYISMVLERCKWDREMATSILCIDKKTLQRKIKKLKDLGFFIPRNEKDLMRHK